MNHFEFNMKKLQFKTDIYYIFLNIFIIINYIIKSHFILNQI